MPDVERSGLPIWVTPLPPVPSGIAQYSQDLLSALDGHWDLHVLAEPVSSYDAAQGFKRITTKDPGLSNRYILQLGNSGYHEQAYRLADAGGSVLVLHDVVLHHARLAAFIQRRQSKRYLALMDYLYGDEGAAAAREILRGAQIDIDRFPLSEDIIERASVVVVHSEYARERVREIGPTTVTVVVPMGIPLPAPAERAIARQHFGMPEDAFVLISITHVNPMKRIPVVLRAFRRLIEREPSSIFVIAGGTSNPGELRRQIQLLGLERHVREVGYLSDNDARLLASAGDVAVNLRYPSAGETSASLLRLMGSGTPVIVTDHGSFRELPEDAALRIPVDRLEEETLAEYLAWLAREPSVRLEIGRLGREFVKTNHSLGAAVDGYREVIQLAWGLNLPALPTPVVFEDPPHSSSPLQSDGDEEHQNPSRLTEDVAGAVFRLGLGGHDGTIRSVATSIVRLGLEGRDVTENNPSAIDPELLEIIACPACKTKVRLDNDRLVCDSCGRSFRIDRGIPIMLLDSE